MNAFMCLGQCVCLCVCQCASLHIFVWTKCMFVFMLISTSIEKQEAVPSLQR